MSGAWLVAGTNNQGQLGLSSSASVSFFTESPGLAGALQVVPGNNFTFVQRPNGTWDILGASPFPSGPVPGLASALKVVVGNDVVYALFPGGVWKAAGNNYRGMLGVGLPYTYNSTEFIVVPALAGATDVHTCYECTNVLARLASGTWVAAGENKDGQLGLRHRNAVYTFTAVPISNQATQVFTSPTSSLAKLSSSSIGNTSIHAYCDNYSGGMLNPRRNDGLCGTFVLSAYADPDTHYSVYSRATPEGTLPGCGTASYLPHNIVDMVNDSWHYMVRTADGKVYSSGLNTAGQLGLGLAASQTIPYCSGHLAGTRYGAY
ncbi:MAG: hypothetical protein Q7S87_01345 [Agitococcus sp.]|nr:hypothetical protein [Agitococcus sp.]